MTWTRTLNTFSAAEAERISGYTPLQQRELRRGGFLPAIESGKARFDVVLLARMIAAKALSDGGLPPSVGWLIAGSCATVITARTLNSGRGVDDPDHLLNEDLIKTSGPMPRYLVAAGASRRGWAHTAEEIGQHLGLASVVLDLELCAQRLVDHAPRPLVSIRAE